MSDPKQSDNDHLFVPPGEEPPHKKKKAGKIRGKTFDLDPEQLLWNVKPPIPEGELHEKLNATRFQFGVKLHINHRIIKSQYKQIKMPY